MSELEAWRDPRVRRGTGRMLARRQALLDKGARPLGWKLAFGAVAVRDQLGLTGPLVGFLTDATLLGADGSCAVGSWAAPRLEPEVAVHMAAPLGADATAAAAREAIAGVSAAIELADVDRPPTELEDVLAGDIYHRAVALAATGPGAGLPAGPIAVEVERDGEPLARSEDAEGAVGRLPELIAYVARYLAAFGCDLAAGEVVITGSVVPLIEVGPGERIRSTLVGGGAVDVVLS